MVKIVILIGSFWHRSVQAASPAGYPHGAGGEPGTKTLAFCHSDAQGGEAMIQPACGAGQSCKLQAWRAKEGRCPGLVILTCAQLNVWFWSPGPASAAQNEN